MDDPPGKLLGSIVKGVAVQRRMLVRDLVKSLGVSRRTYLRWCGGTTIPQGRRFELVLRKLAEYDASAAQRAGDLFGVRFATAAPPAPAPPPNPLANVAAQLALTAELHNLSPAALRAAFLRMLDAAVEHGWPVSQLRDDLAQVASVAAAAKTSPPNV